MADGFAGGAGTCPCAVSRRSFLTAGTCAVTALLAGVTGEAVALHIEAQERTYPIPATDGVTIDRDAQVILVRVEHQVFAFNLSCPHQNAAVRWNNRGRQFQCSRHDSRYSPDGTHTAGRATRNMDRFPIKKAGANVVVDVSHIVKSDEDPTGWKAAAVPVE